MKRNPSYAVWLLVGVLFAGTPVAFAQQPVELQGRVTKPAAGGAPTFSPIYSCNKSAIYDAGSSGSTEMVALISGKTIYLCGYTILSAGTVNVKFITGTGTACATGSANLTPAFQLTAQVGAVDGSPFYRGLAGAASAALCINTSGGVPVQAIVYYLQF